MLTAADEALLAGIAVGDEDAARTFVRRYQHRVYGLAVTIVGDRQLAEDVAQEVFLRVWRHAGAFDARRGGAATWVLAVTRNAAIDAIRVRRPVMLDPGVILALVGPGAEAGPDQPEEAAVTDDDLHRVRDLLALLPAEQRSAVVLATYLGWTAAEVAEHDDIPLGTAKTRIRTGLRKVRAGLIPEVTS